MQRELDAQHEIANFIHEVIIRLFPLQCSLALCYSSLSALFLIVESLLQCEFQIGCLRRDIEKVNSVLTLVELVCSSRSVEHFWAQHSLFAYILL